MYKRVQDMQDIALCTSPQWPGTYERDSRSEGCCSYQRSSGSELSSRKSWTFGAKEHYYQHDTHGQQRGHFDELARALEKDLLGIEAGGIQQKH